MSFAPKPTESKNKINKAADIVARGKIKGATSDEDVVNARKLVDAWRVAHAYPLNVFNANLRNKVRLLPGALVAQRLKRMPTILDKLGTRETHMDYTNMQDLGGVRAILRNQKDVDKLARRFLNSKAPHELKEDTNYTECPRSSGYRGRHLVYKFKSSSPLATQYNDLMIEIQLRTKLQHIWATSVETVGVVTGQDLKSSRGDSNLLRFFKVLSAAFSHIEGTPVIDEYSKYSKEEIFQIVVSEASRLHIKEKLSSYLVVIDHVSSNTPNKDFKKAAYYVLKLDTKEKSVSIRAFPTLEAANKEYEQKEALFAGDDTKDVVLVSVAKYNELRKAYPNYFADSKNLLSEIEKMEKAIKNR